MLQAAPTPCRLEEKRGRDGTGERDQGFNHGVVGEGFDEGETSKIRVKWGRGLMNSS